MAQPSSHPACIPVDQLLQQCDVKRTRGSGPGGQHRNKVETAIVITHRSSGIVGQASEKRSQAANREQAIFRLRVNLALAQRQTSDDVAELVGELWSTRIRSGKIHINEAHDEFPAMLAVALDVLHHFDYDGAQSAGLLDCTTSQLIRFLKKEPAAFAQVNRNRRESGLSPYR